MARPDGRVEPGQRISSAFSARAWNRAQDAADIVLGSKTGLAAGGDPQDRLRYLTIRIPQTAVTDQTNSWPAHITTNVENHKLNVGYALPIAGMLGGESIAKSTLDDIPTLDASPTWLDSGLFEFNTFNWGSDLFGVIAGVLKGNQPSDNYFYVRMIVGGVFSCRCLAFAKTDRLIAPVPVPASNEVNPMWYPYPVAAPAGTAKILAYGNYWKITSNDWPRIYQVLVQM